MDTNKLRSELFALRDLITSTDDVAEAARLERVFQVGLSAIEARLALSVEQLRAQEAAALRAALLADCPELSALGLVTAGDFTPPPEPVVVAAEPSAAVVSEPDHRLHGIR